MDYHISSAKPSDFFLPGNVWKSALPEKGFGKSMKLLSLYLYLRSSQSLNLVRGNLVLVSRHIRDDVPMHRRSILRSLLVVPDRTSCVRAATDSWRVNRHVFVILGPAQHMHIVPHLAQDSPTSITCIAALACFRLVVSWARASKVRHGPMHGRESVLDLKQIISRAITWRDAILLQPLEGWESPVVSNRSLKKINHIFVLLILGAVARDIEGGVAGCMLGELVAPKVGIRTSPGMVLSAIVFRPDLHPLDLLRDPVFVHPSEQVISAKRLHKSANVGTFVGSDDSAVG